MSRSTLIPIALAIVPLIGVPIAASAQEAAGFSVGANVVTAFGETGPGLGFRAELPVGRLGSTADLMLGSSFWTAKMPIGTFPNVGREVRGAGPYFGIAWRPTGRFVVLASVSVAWVASSTGSVPGTGLPLPPIPRSDYFGQTVTGTGLGFGIRLRTPVAAAVAVEGGAVATYQKLFPDQEGWWPRIEGGLRIVPSALSGTPGSGDGR